MSTTFLSKDVWPRLTKAVRGSRRPCDVAVAYFGAGAGRLLPLPEGSRLVVNASEPAVAAGQTCPEELIKLVKQGVAVYSVPNLHAKVFVVENAAYVGSTNISNRSAGHLIEAILRTTEPGAVRAAKQFVKDNCLHELTPTVLERLAKLYRPPVIPGSPKGGVRSPGTSERPALPRVLLAQLHRQGWSDRDEVLHAKGLIEAKERREHPRSYELDSFRMTGTCRYLRGDVVIQVIKEDDGRMLVSPPANVIHVRTRKAAKGQVYFVYVEHPVRRRRSAATMAKQLGTGAAKRLRRDGLVRDTAFVQELLNLWAA